MTLVDSEKATDAAPFGELTSILMPDTDAIEPPTSSSPSALTGVSDAGAATDVVVDADADSLDELLVEDPHATVDNAGTLGPPNAVNGHGIRTRRAGLPLFNHSGGRRGT